MGRLRKLDNLLLLQCFCLFRHPVTRHEGFAWNDGSGRYEKTACKYLKYLGHLNRRSRDMPRFRGD